MVERLKKSEHAQPDSKAKEKGVLSLVSQNLLTVWN